MVSWRGTQLWRGTQTWRGASGASVAASSWRGAQTWRNSRSWRGLSPAQAGADPSNVVVGWNVEVLAAASTALRTAQWDRIAATGATIVRADAYWSALQPNAGAASVTPGLNDAFDATAIANLDAFFDDAATRGIKVWLNAAFTPAWARPGFTVPSGLGYGQDDHIPPTRDRAGSYSDYANFVWNITARYEQRHPGTLVAIGVWNEPNVREFWLQPPTTSTTSASWSPDAVEYATLLDGAYTAIKTGVVAGRTHRASYPHIYVTAGATAPAAGGGLGADYSPLAFVAAFMAAGALNSFDHLDHHPYSWQWGPGYNADWNPFQQIHDLWGALKFFGRTDAYIWCSEIGAVSRPDASGTDPLSPFGVGGWSASSTGSPSSGQYLTSGRAINYTLLEQRIRETFDLWRGPDFFDATIGRQITGVMVWYELHDRADGIGTTWAVSDESYFGFYEYGSNRFNGPAKGNAAAAWTSYVAPDTQAPSVTFLAPSPGSIVSGHVSVSAAVADDRDPVVADVQLLVDDVLAGPMPWYFVNVYDLNTNALSDGTHTLAVRAQDAAGNVTITPPLTVTVDNTTAAVPDVPLGEFDPVSPWHVFVRDAAYQRQAEIGPAAVLKIKARKNDVWTWTLTCPFNDPAVEYLLDAQAGIELRYGQKLVMGGIRTGFDRDWNSDADTITFNGESDLVFVEWRNAHPDPAHADQLVLTQAEDVRSGPADDVIAGYVHANIGAGAVPARQKAGWVTETSAGVGATVQPYRARMQNLLTLIQDIAAVGGTLFDAAASPSVGGIVFTQRLPVDRSETVKFSPQYGNIEKFRYGQKRPTANVEAVGDDQAGGSRKFVEVQDTVSVAEWGRIEGFVSSSASATAELQQDGLAALLEDVGVTELQVTPLTAIHGIQWPTDYGLGDIVAVIVDGVTVREEVVEVTFVRDANGIQITPAVGVTFLNGIAAARSGRRLHARVRDLERK